MSKVVVLYGGFSEEREVSLNSGKNVAEALKNKGHEVELYDVKKDFLALVEFVSKNKDKIFFNALHGVFGEDGNIQVVLENLGVSYTHSPFLASAIAMNKVITKQICKTLNIPVVKDEVCNINNIDKTSINLPYVIKPVAEGSSVGVFIVKNQEDINKAKQHYKNSEEVMVEEYVGGNDITVGIMNGRAMAVTELIVKDGFYDYRAKYTENVTKHIVPAQIPQGFYNEAMMISEQVFHAIGCKGVARADFRFDGKRIVFLEINTQPGMTSLSLVPEQALYLGMNYEDICELILSMANK